MNFVKRFIRNWFTSASLLNLSDEFSTFERKIIALKDDSAQAKLYNQLNGLAEDLKNAIEEEETQKGWKIFKEIRRLFVWSMPKEEMMSRAHTVLKETESKTQSSPWRLLAVKEILGVGEDGKTLRTDLTAGQVIKAAEILDDHQDNFYEKLETLRRRIRTLSWITFVSLAVWVWIGPQISEFPLQKELSGKDLEAQYKAIYNKIDSLDKKVAAKSTNPNNPQPNLNKVPADSIKQGQPGATPPDNKPNTPAQDTPIQHSLDQKGDKRVPKENLCECKKDTSMCCESRYSGVKDIHKRPRWLALLVILTGLIGAVVSGFIRTIQSGAEGTVPDSIFGSTLLAARLMLASVAALSVYIFLGTGVILMFGTKISFELLLAFSFVAGFSEQLVQKGVEALSKQDLYNKKDQPGK